MADTRPTLRGADLIFVERQRQIEAEGWTPDHDDHHSNGELWGAAMCYLRAGGPDAPVSNLWPWENRCGRTGQVEPHGGSPRTGYPKRTFSGPWPQPAQLPFVLDGIALAIDRILDGQES